VVVESKNKRKEKGFLAGEKDDVILACREMRRGGKGGVHRDKTLVEGGGRRGGEKKKAISFFFVVKGGDFARKEGR